MSPKASQLLSVPLLSHRGAYIVWCLGGKTVVSGTSLDSTFPASGFGQGPALAHKQPPHLLYSNAPQRRRQQQTPSALDLHRVYSSTLRALSLCYSTSYSSLAFSVAAPDRRSPTSFAIASCPRKRQPASFTTSSTPTAILTFSKT